MTFPVRQTYADYVELQAATRRAMTARWLCVGAGVAMVGMGFMPFSVLSWRQALFTVGPWAVVIAALGVFAPRLMAAGVWAKLRRVDGKTDLLVELADDAALVHDGGHTARWPWGDLAGRTETANLIVLWRRGRTSIAIPKRDLRSAGVEDEFRRRVEGVRVTRRIRWW